MWSSRRTRSGFSIIELLVVISIIGLLAALLLPALGGAKRRAAKANEMNLIRQVGVAWELYARNNNDAALPGYVEPEVQGTGTNAWDVTYRYPDKTPVDVDYAGPWPWRLAKYLEFNHEVMHGYLNETETDPFAMQREAEEVAFEPAFGYNAYYVGGWWEMRAGGGVVRPRPRFDDATDADTGAKVAVITRSPSNIRNPSTFVLFSSASELDQGEYRKFDENQPGSHYVVPPFLGEDERWRKSLNNPSDKVIEVVGGASAPIGRYTNAAAVLHGDLHTESHTVGSLADQRFWIGAATSKKWKHTGPQ